MQLIVSFLKMADNAARNLRVRRPPQYLMGDNSQPQFFGYNKTNITKDFISPAQQLNSVAKILVKFVNSTNRRMLSSHLDLLDKMNDTESMQKPEKKIKDFRLVEDPKKSKSGEVCDRNDRSQNKEGKNNSKSNRDNREGRDNHNGKSQPSDQSIGKQKLKLIDGNKKYVESSKLTRYSVKSDSQTYLNNLNKLQQAKLMQEYGNGNIDRVKFDAKLKALQQQQEILNYNPNLRQKLQGRIKEESESSQKCFKKSSYHILIAYQIFRSNLKQSLKNKNSLIEMDPTYFSRKLRGEIDKNTSSEEKKR